MITNKDLSIDSENGKITLNGNKYDLGTQGEIDTAVKNVYSVMGEMGAKNLIPYPYYESDHTENGITWTVNSDGSVTANGTATENSTFIFRQRTEQTKFVEKNTSYILSGCPSGGSNSKYMLYMFVQTQEPTNITSGTDFGNGATINMPDQDYYGIYTFARVISGQTVSNLTFKPMLRLAADTDNTYEPYAMTNKQLTDQLATKQDTLTFDNAPTASSDNPVKSDGIKTAIDDAVNIVSVPDSFITLESGISIQTNRLYKQGKHIFGWITFSFSAQIPSSLKLGVINAEYRPTDSTIIRMIAGLGTDAWKCEYVGYCLKDTDNSLSITGYDAGIKAAHLHIDYVI